MTRAEREQIKKLEKRVQHLEVAAKVSQLTKAEGEFYATQVWIEPEYQGDEEGGSGGVID